VIATNVDRKIIIIIIIIIKWRFIKNL
jgi:hypothetical protein